jgi:hypothetical protein
MNSSKLQSQRQSMRLLKKIKIWAKEVNIIFLINLV